MAQSKYLIAYVAAWAPYGGYGIYRDIDANRLTHLNYAFAVISEDLKITLGDPHQDLLNFSQLHQLKGAYPHLKTVISIGGWAGSANFSKVAASEKTRARFINSVLEFMIRYGFDGVDLDWEYPVIGGGPGTYPNPQDRLNFPLLLKAMRLKLKERSRQDGADYSLSIAGAASLSFIENTQIGWAHEYVDYVQVMAYDLHGTRGKLAGFNAPLYDGGGKIGSVSQAVQAYLQAGVPKEKLVLGVPFYGYRYLVSSPENNGLRQQVVKRESIPYKLLRQKGLLAKGYDRYWDEGTAAPYLFHPEELVFISHDDPESITLKAEYIQKQGLGGAMIWEISQDYESELLDALYQILKDGEAGLGKPHGFRI